MRLRLLAVYPLLYAAAFFALASALAGGDAVAPFVLWQRTLVRALSAVGCFAAVSVFSRGDHLRRAWLWLGIATSVMLVRDILLRFAFFQAGDTPAAAWTPNALVVVANVFFVGGIWMLARSWRMAAIALPGGRLGSAAVVVVTAALALAVAGPATVAEARQVAGGDWNTLAPLASSVADILSLCLIAPLLLTAVSLRGGLFSWPWALLTASQLGWLLVDAAIALGAGTEPTGFTLVDFFRSLAGNYLFVAGLAQRLVVRQVRRAAG